MLVALIAMTYYLHQTIVGSYPGSEGNEGTRGGNLRATISAAQGQEQKQGQRQGQGVPVPVPITHPLSGKGRSGDAIAELPKRDAAKQLGDKQVDDREQEGIA